MKTMGKLFLIVATAVILVWVSAFFNMMPLLVIFMIGGLMAAFLMHQRRKDAFSFYFTLRRFALTMLVFASLGAIVMVLGMGIYGLVGAVPLVGLAFWFYRHADNKHRNYVRPDSASELSNKAYHEQRGREHKAAIDRLRQSGAEAEEVAGIKSKARADDIIREIFGDDADDVIRRTEEKLAASK